MAKEQSKKKDVKIEKKKEIKYILDPQEALLREIKELLTKNLEFQSNIEKRLNNIEKQNEEDSDYIYGDVNVKNFPLPEKIDFPEFPDVQKVFIQNQPKKAPLDNAGTVRRNTDGTTSEIVEELEDGTKLHVKFYYNHNGEMTGWKKTRRS